MEFKYRTALLGLLVALVIAGCASMQPGPYATNYQQSTIVPSASVSSVTVLRLSDEAEQQMLAGNVVLVGTSQFQTTFSDGAICEAAAKTQAQRIGANVVILHQRKVRTDTHTREKIVKTDWQKALEANDVSYEKDFSYSKTKTSHPAPGKTKTTTKSASGSFGVSLAGIGRLLGGEKTVQEEYQVDVYEVRAVFVRDPTYPGLD